MRGFGGSLWGARCVPAPEFRSKGASRRGGEVAALYSTPGKEQLLKYFSPRLQKGHRSRSWDPRDLIVLLYIFSSEKRTAHRMLLCPQNSATPQPCLHGVVVGAALLSDLQEALEFSEWKQYWLLKAVSRKRSLKVDVNLFLDKTGVQEALRQPRYSPAS